MARSFYGLDEDTGDLQQFDLGQHQLFDLHEDEEDYQDEDED